MSNLAEQILAAVQADEDEAKRALSDPIGQTEHGIAHWVSHLRRCAADREIVDHYVGLVTRYKRLKANNIPGTDFRSVETLIADYAAVTIPALARGYGIQPTPGGDHA